MASQRTYTGSTVTDSSTYDYDALDRVSKETEAHNGTADDRTTSFTYQGLTTKATEEKQAGGTSPKTKSFSYDAYGHRISMTSQVNGTTTTDSFSYAYDVHGSVSQRVNDTGGVKASYGYTAYGGEDSELSSKQDATADTNTNPLNPYGFQGRRLDSGGATATSASSSLDMGARRYAADTGRFLQEDMFASALGDLGLSLDPLSQNTYALAGGNPISFVEFDGHMLIADGGGGGSTSPSPTTSTSSSCCTSSSSSSSSGSTGSSPTLNLAQETISGSSEAAAGYYSEQWVRGLKEQTEDYAARAARRTSWASSMTQGGRYSGSDPHADYYKYLDDAKDYSSKAAASGATATKMSRFTKLGGKSIPVAGAVAGYFIDTANGESKGRAASKAAGGLAGGALAGAATGAALGSGVPGVGNVVGGIVGGIVGGFIGSGVGASIFDNGLSLGSVGEGISEGVGELGDALGDVGSALNPFD
jgi:RHS repeat-associated protein